jgi:hypothetical protein
MCCKLLLIIVDNAKHMRKQYNIVVAYFIFCTHLMGYVFIILIVFESFE